MLFEGCCLSALSSWLGLLIPCNAAWPSWVEMRCWYLPRSIDKEAATVSRTSSEMTAINMRAERWDIGSIARARQVSGLGENAPLVALHRTVQERWPKR